MVSLGIVNHGTCPLTSMVAMVANPCLAKNNLAKAVFPSGYAALEVILGVLVARVSGIMESMRCRPKADDGFASHKIVVDIAHLFRRELTKPRKNDHQFGMFQRLQTGYIGLLIGVDFAATGVQRKQHCTGIS